LEDRYKEFELKNVGIIGISVDGLDGVKSMYALVNPSYPILSDADTSVSKLYKVYDLLGDGVATPAVYIIHKDRSIMWKKIASDAGDRPSVDEILIKLDSLGF